MHSGGDLAGHFSVVDHGGAAVYCGTVRQMRLVSGINGIMSISGDCFVIFAGRYAMANLRQLYVCRLNYRMSQYSSPAAVRFPALRCVRVSLILAHC